MTQEPLTSKFKSLFLALVAVTEVVKQQGVALGEEPNKKTEIRKDNMTFQKDKDYLHVPPSSMLLSVPVAFPFLC